MPKDKLLEFDEPSGLKYILWACDKRIGKNKLLQMEFIKQAIPIVKSRVPDYNLEPCLGNGQTLVYSDEKINIFGKIKGSSQSLLKSKISIRTLSSNNLSFSDLISSP